MHDGCIKDKTNVMTTEAAGKNTKNDMHYNCNRKLQKNTD